MVVVFYSHNVHVHVRPSYVLSDVASHALVSGFLVLLGSILKTPCSADQSLLSNFTALLLPLYWTAHHCSSHPCDFQ